MNFDLRPQEPVGLHTSMVKVNSYSQPELSVGILVTYNTCTYWYWFFTHMPHATCTATRKIMVMSIKLSLTKSTPPDLKTSSEGLLSRWDVLLSFVCQVVATFERVPSGLAPFDRRGFLLLWCVIGISLADTLIKMLASFQPLTRVSFICTVAQKNNATMSLTPNAIRHMFDMVRSDDNPSFSPIVQVLHLKKIDQKGGVDDRWKVSLFLDSS